VVERLLADPRILVEIEVYENQGPFAIARKCVILKWQQPIQAHQPRKIGPGRRKLYLA
jgi:hypothetical protein